MATDRGPNLFDLTASLVLIRKEYSSLQWGFLEKRKNIITVSLVYQFYNLQFFQSELILLRGALVTICGCLQTQHSSHNDSFSKH